MERLKIATTAFTKSWNICERTIHVSITYYLSLMNVNSDYIKIPKVLHAASWRYVDLFKMIVHALFGNYARDYFFTCRRHSFVTHTNPTYIRITLFLQKHVLTFLQNAKWLYRYNDLSYIFLQIQIQNIVIFG